MLLTEPQNRSVWENLDLRQYPFQLIKFMNLVVPSLITSRQPERVIYRLQTQAIFKIKYDKISFTNDRLVHVFLTNSCNKMLIL